MAFQVQKQACETCIYGKHSASSESPAKLEAEVADKYMPGFFKGYRICHNSKKACCRGFWNRHKNHFQAGQLAQRLNCVEFVIHKG